jgi:hypothetical protein
VFFKKIKQINHEFAVIFGGGNIAVRPLPNLGREPKALDLPWIIVPMRIVV